MATHSITRFGGETSITEAAKEESSRLDIQSPQDVVSIKEHLIIFSPGKEHFLLKRQKRKKKKRLYEQPKIIRLQINTLKGIELLTGIQ